MSSNLKVLVGDLYNRGHSTYTYRFAKVSPLYSRKESYGFAKVLRNTCHQDIRFQDTPRKIWRKIRDSSAILATKENASSTSPWPMSWKQRVVK